MREGRTARLEKIKEGEGRSVFGEMERKALS